MNRLWWTFARKALARYVQKNPYITRCYLRHSSAFGPQNPLLSDLDVSFFVNAKNLSELKEQTRSIRHDMESLGFFSRLIDQPAILPTSTNAVELCRRYYRHRSIYPFESWMEIGAAAPSALVAPSLAVPLDHSPEGFLASHLIPVLTQTRKRRPLEGAFVRRKLQQDAESAGLHDDGWRGGNLYEALQREISIWSQFYLKLATVGGGESLVFRETVDEGRPRFNERWQAAAKAAGQVDGFSSLWIYPCSHEDNRLMVALNVKTGIATENLRRLVNVVGDAFRGLNNVLMIGHEASMISRINALARVSLLEPWLFRHRAECLAGDPSAREKIRFPSVEILRTKFNEFLLYFWMQMLQRATFPYATYRLCYTMDHLFMTGEIQTDWKELSGIYGPDFIAPSAFVPARERIQLVNFVKERHGFDPFGPV